MNTRDLIEVLVADHAAVSAKPGTAITLAVGIGAVVTALGLLPLIGIRPDLAGAVLTLRFVVKVALALALAISATALTWRLSRPDASLGIWKWALLAILLALLFAAAIELAVSPPSQWETRLFGVHWYVCVLLMTVFSLPLLAGLCIALRHAAPGNSGLAGAISGIAAGGIAATIYTAHCPDDSPLFVAAWYSLAIGIVALLGHFAGRRWLIW